jgi:putative oxidoreductase
MTDFSTAAARDHGIALLRIGLGVMFLAHGLLLKVFTYGMTGTAAFFESVGFPAWLAWVTMLAETIGGLLLVAGIGTRLAALGLAPILLGAWYVHAGNGWVFTAANGGWEYPAYLLVLCLAQALLGSGSFSLRPARTA